MTDKQVEPRSGTAAKDAIEPPEPVFKVLVIFEHVGWHCWPQAPPRRAYLRNDHRHLFKFKVELLVNHADRDIEIHDLKETCEAWAARYYAKTTTDSCEQMAWWLLNFLRGGYQPLSGRVECWEDGECGGAVEMTWAREVTDK